MRVTVFVVALVLLVSGTAASQEWDEYTNVRDGFKINFPGQPKVTESTWTSQLNYTLPMRVYSAEKGPVTGTSPGRERYSLTGSSVRVGRCAMSTLAPSVVEGDRYLTP